MGGPPIFAVLVRLLVPSMKRQMDITRFNIDHLASVKSEESGNIMSNTCTVRRNKC